MICPGFGLVICEQTCPGFGLSFGFHGVHPYQKNICRPPPPPPSNPDQVVNSYGRKLLSLCHDNNLTFINGLTHSSRRFDSNFTFFRCSLKSQNDWCISNSVNNINSFCILPKINVSDHAPCAVTIKCNATVSLDLLEDIANGLLNYSHYDRSDEIKPKIWLHKINANGELINGFSRLAACIQDRLNCQHPNIDALAVDIIETLYTICKKNYKRESPKMCIPKEKSTCASKHFHDVADAIFICIHNL